VKLINLRIRLAKLLFKWSVKLSPPPERTEAYKSLPDELKIPMDAVVELNEEPLTWTPEQHGNIVVAEPTLMALDRRMNKK
jgi:hypothetical protein